MATLISAAFNGTDGVDLAGYTPETGGDFEYHTSSDTDKIRFRSNRALGPADGAGNVFGFFDTQFGHADCEAEITVQWLSSTDNEPAACVRMNTVAETYVMACFDRANNRFRLYEVVNGSRTQIDTDYYEAFDSGTKTIRVKVTGSTAEMYVGGTLRKSGTTNVTDAGRAGIAFDSVTGHTTTGYAIESFTASGTPGGIPGQIVTYYANDIT